MTISARPIALFADFRVLRTLRWILAAAALAAVAVPDTADAQQRARAKVARPGAFDGTWNIQTRYAKFGKKMKADQEYTGSFQTQKNIKFQDAGKG